MCEKDQRGRRGQCTDAFSVTRLLVAYRRVNMATGASVGHVGGRNVGGEGMGTDPSTSLLPPLPNLLLPWPGVTFGMFTARPDNCCEVQNGPV